MTIPNPHRGEVAFRLDEEREIILRLDWAAVAKVSGAWRSDVEKLKEKAPETEVDWGGVLNKAFADYDMEKIAFFLAAAAARHHPEVTPRAIMDASPSRYLALQATNELIALFFWGPDGAPREVAKKVPFGLATLLASLSKLRPHTA